MLSEVVIVEVLDVKAGEVIGVTDGWRADMELASAGRLTAPGRFARPELAVPRLRQPSQPNLTRSPTPLRNARRRCDPTSTTH